MFQGTSQNGREEIRQMAYFAVRTDNHPIAGVEVKPKFQDKQGILLARSSSRLDSRAVLSGFCLRFCGAFTRSHSGLRGHEIGK